MNKNIARLAVTAGLTAALSFGGVMAPVTMAFAEMVPTVATKKGKVSITDTEYTDTSFKGIQIFKATVTQNKDGNTWSGDKTLSDIDWATLEVQKAVIGAFTRADGTRVDGAPRTDTSAQAWAKYINDHAGDKVGQTAKVDADSTLDKIAAALEGSNLTWTKPSDSSKGNFESLNQGYWLFVTDVPSKTGNTDAYTSPIFTIVGGSDVNVAPKKSVPNVTKAVKDDNNGSFVTDESKNVFEAPNRVADSASDQLIEYQLAGTVASNINTYKEYSYTFTDVLPSTMVPELNGNDPVVEVKIGDQVVHPSSYNKSYVDGKLEVSFSNLKNAHVKKQDGTEGAVIIVDGSSKVYVNYKARLDPTKVGANMLGKGQKNTVTLTYSNNPHDNNGTDATVDHPAYDYTYGIDVKKVGSDEAKPPLANVEFTLQEVGTGKFIKEDGTTASNETENGAILKTNSNGMIEVFGLDEGTYILKEKTPAPGYDNSHGSKGIKFTITRDGELSESDNTVHNPKLTVTDADDQNLVAAANATNGVVHLTVTDQKGSNLPLTGLNGVTFTWIAGGAVLCIGVAHLIRSRKQAEESEQE
ncbi:MAG: SpaA isopeptide-forming pilin-related protein [Collinsella sp.]